MGAPEDRDGFEDEDGCPDPDNDGDGLCDPWVDSSGQLGRYSDECTGVDQCPNTPRIRMGSRIWMGVRTETTTGTPFATLGRIERTTP